MTDESLLKQYEGAFEAWKARLAIGRIKAMGFPKGEWPDLMQDMAVVIFEFRYDPNHTKCAKEETALYIAINNRLVSKLRQRYRNKEQFDQYLRELGVREDGSYVGAEPCATEEPGLSDDLGLAVSRLSEFDQAVARGLAAGVSKAALARELDCEWNTIQKAVRRIRDHFEELGFDGEGR